MPLKNGYAVIFRMMWSTAAMFAVVLLVFGAYVYTEKQIDRANELRQNTYQLADQLHQSVDDQTGMAQAYVVTGEPRFKRYHQDIRDIRDGKLIRPEAYFLIYWDNVLANPVVPHPKDGQAIALLDVMRKAGFTDTELAMMADAKAKSDALSRFEIEVMALAESAGTDAVDVAEAKRQKARAMLHGDVYLKARAGIMNPINQFFIQVDTRTLAAVHQAENIAFWFRVLFICTILSALFMLWQIFSRLRVTLGGSLNDVHAQILRIGRGDFCAAIALAPGMEDSVMAGLAAMQIKLNAFETERKASELALQSSQARLNSIFDSSPDAMLISDMHGVIVMANQQIERLLDYTVDELIGQSIEMLVPERFRAGHTALRAKFGALASARRMGDGREIKVRRKDGTGCDVEITLNRIETDQGLLVVSALRDITEQKQVEAELRIAAAAFQSQEGMVVTDCNGVILRINAAFTRLTGYDAEDAVGRTPSILKSGRHDKEFYRAMWESIRDHDIWQGEVWDRRKNGEIYPEWLTISAVRDENGNVSHYIGTHADISQKKAAEAAQAANQAKSEFLSSMSHELRTPLNAILGFAQLLEYDETLNADQQDNVAEVLRGGRHLLELVNELLDLAKIESGRIDLSIGPVCLADLAEECFHLTQPLVKGKQITLRMDVPANVLVCADHMRLKQILLNLLSNAIKYNREQGGVHLRAELVSAVLARISVGDTGVGISAEHVKSLFQPFNRLAAENSNIEGTGIGLSIVRKLVELMGGGIGVDSQIGVGSTFWIELPVAEAIETKENI